MKLYHKDVFMPAEVSEALKTVHVRLHWGPHARRAFVQDRYGLVHEGNHPTELRGADCEAVEAEVDDCGKLVKAVFRRRFSRRVDIVLVVQSDGFVRTVWGNRPDDRHGTLNVDLYAKA